MNTIDIWNRNRIYYKENFEKLRKSNVIILGCGGVGSFAAEFLARSGLNIILVDKDKVDITNLARQNFTLDDVGKPKVIALKERINSIVNNVNIETIFDEFNEKNAEKILKKGDIALVAFDTLKPVEIVNNTAKRLRIPYVNASAIMQQGEIWFSNRNSLIDKIKLQDGLSNAEVGVDSIVPSIIGLIAAEMIINYIAFGKTFENKLYRFNFKEMQFYMFKY